MPVIEDLRDFEARTACHDGLVALREMRQDLEPTPDHVIDSAGSDWFNVAEAAMFECPPTSDSDYSATFADLARLAAEVESVLELDR